MICQRFTLDCSILYLTVIFNSFVNIFFLFQTVKIEQLDISTTCLICHESLEENDVEVKKRGLTNLHSLLREDGFDKILKTAESIVVHIDCRKKYIQDKYINHPINSTEKPSVSNVSPKKRLRTSSPFFLTGILLALFVEKRLILQENIQNQ